MMLTDAELAARLERFIASRTGSGARVTRLERSTEGFSQGADTNFPQHPLRILQRTELKRDHGTEAGHLTLG